MPALTIYGLSTASTSLPTANQATSTGGGSSTSTKATLIGTSTGFGRIAAQGATSAWPALNGLQSPGGMGFLWDVTTLEQQQILAGAWTPSVTLFTSAGSIVADLYVRVYLWNNGMYIPASSTQGPNYAVLTGQTINITPATFTLPATTFPPMTFLPGWKLYFDLWANITTNSTGSGSATLSLREASTTSGITALQLVTPGYQALSQSQLTNQRTFGGFPLHDGVNYLLQEKSFDFPPISETYFPIARSGNKMTGFRVNQKPIPVSVTVLGYNRADVESKLDALSLALSARQQKLVLHALDGRYWVANAVAAPVQFAPGRLLSVPVNISFVAAQPYAYAATSNSFSTGSVSLSHTGTTWFTPVQTLVGGGTIYTQPTITVTNNTTANATTLATALVSGNVYTSITVAALPGAIGAGCPMTLTSGAHVQTVTATSFTSAGATTINVTSFTANFSYPIGTAVACTTTLPSVTITQQTTGQSLTLSNLSMANGDVLTVVCDPLAANGYTATINGGSPLDFTGLFPYMDPSPDTWQVTIDDATSRPTITVTWTWTPRWLL